MKWPDTADGDVFRRLEGDNFDFTKEATIDINIDFDHWPLSTECIQFMIAHWPGIEIIEPEEDDYGWATFQIRTLLTYEMIVDYQIKVSEMISPYGGRCESWGLFSS